MTYTLASGLILTPNSVGITASPNSITANTAILADPFMATPSAMATDSAILTDPFVASSSSTATPASNVMPPDVKITTISGVTITETATGTSMTATTGAVPVKTTPKSGWETVAWVFFPLLILFVIIMLLRRKKPINELPPVQYPTYRAEPPVQSMG